MTLRLNESRVPINFLEQVPQSGEIIDETKSICLLAASIANHSWRGEPLTLLQPEIANRNGSLCRKMASYNWELPTCSTTNRLVSVTPVLKNQPVLYFRPSGAKFRFQSRGISFSASPHPGLRRFSRMSVFVSPNPRITHSCHYRRPAAHDHGNNES